jgi:hypothetical protein
MVKPSASRGLGHSLLSDDDLAERSEQARRDALADLNRVFFAPEVAAWTKGRRSVNEVGIELLERWFVPDTPPLAIAGSEVLGVVPLEVTDALRRRSAAWPTATSAASWSSRSWSCSRRADPVGFTMSEAAEGS